MRCPSSTALFTQRSPKEKLVPARAPSRCDTTIDRDRHLSPGAGVRANIDFAPPRLVGLIGDSPTIGRECRILLHEAGLEKRATFFSVVQYPKVVARSGSVFMKSQGGPVGRPRAGPHASLCDIHNLGRTAAVRGLRVDICVNSGIASLTGTRPFAIRSASVSPSTSSITRNCWPSDSSRP